MTSIELSTETNKPHEEHLATRRAYDGHLLHVRVDDVRLPSGRETKREMIEHPGSVIVLPVTTDAEVLLIRQYRYVTGEYLIELPAGLIDEREEPKDAATRELKEETGYEAGKLTFLGAAWASPGYTQEETSFYVATECVQVEHEPDEDEPIEIIHIPLDDLPGLLQPGKSPIRNAQTLLTLNWFLRLQDELLG